MANHKFDRRDLLKAFGIGGLGLTASQIVRALPDSSSNSGHYIIIVFDSWSAHNVGLYGYQRDTMPNLSKFADQAFVFNKHHSGGNFTVPGVASLLTGMYPFSHRAIDLHCQVIAQHQGKDIFNVFSDQFSTFGFAQNMYADQLIGQADKGVDKHTPFGSYNLNDVLIYDSPFFDRDAYIAFNAIDFGLVNHRKGEFGSLIFGPLMRTIAMRDLEHLGTQYADTYNMGLPEGNEAYTLEGIINGLMDTLKGLNKPSFVYFHVHAPHAPYRPIRKNHKLFEFDGLGTDVGPVHPLVEEPDPEYNLKRDQVLYDAYLYTLDSELARLFKYLDKSGLRQNSTIAITADHGEIHQFGTSGHSTPLLYEPLTHIPLVLSIPGINTRVDVNTPTSCVDLLPTFAEWAGLPVPEWTEGKPLPILGKQAEPGRPIFAFEAKTNTVFGRFTKYSISMLVGDLKLIRYHYPGYISTEMYDLAADPGELNNLAESGHPKFDELAKQLNQKLAQIGADID